MSPIIDHLADHAAFLPRIAAWQHAEFGYLNPSTTLDDRLARLERSLQREALPTCLVALSEDQSLLGCAAILASTITHSHLGPWLSSGYVPPEHRGKGVASALARRALIEAARLGHERLSLHAQE